MSMWEPSNYAEVRKALACFFKAVRELDGDEAEAVQFFASLPDPSVAAFSNDHDGFRRHAVESQEYGTAESTFSAVDLFAEDWEDNPTPSDRARMRQEAAGAVAALTLMEQLFQRAADRTHQYRALADHAWAALSGGYGWKEAMELGRDRPQEEQVEPAATPAPVAPPSSPRPTTEPRRRAAGKEKAHA